MVKQLWSINALATELGRDRRTIAKALRAVPPDGSSPRGHKAWHLQTVLDAFAGADRRGQLPAPPLDGFEVLEQIKDPLDQAALGTLLSLVYQIGPLSASLAVGAGASMRAAFALHNMMIVACAAEADGFCEGIIPRGSDGERAIFKLSAVAQTDWDALAKLSGEPVDMEAWQAWARERAKFVASAVEE